MKRTLLGLALLLSACAPRTALIASGVSATLTALAPTPILPADRTTSTAVPTLPPAPTSLATAAPAASPTLADPARPIPSAPASPTAIPAAPTEAASASAPPASGDLIFLDTFESAGLWSVGETNSSNVAISGGIMSFTQKVPGAFSVRIVGKQGADFYAEVSAALAGRCASGDRYGLMFRAQDPGDFYALQVDCDGRYRLVRYASGAAAPLIDWTPSDAIQRGRQSTNTLAVAARGGDFQVIINGAPLATASDSAFADGRFGLMVGANITKNFTVLFDNLKANKLP